jgi:hypothetical protein
VNSRAGETAYYLNGKLPRLVLIAKGVRFPAGTWIRVADSMLAPWEVEPLVMDLFVTLKDRPLPFKALLTDLDVDEFETR